MQKPKRFALRHVGRERGAVAVEFAIIFPILLLLVFGIIDFGFGFHAWDASENAAREGARVGAVNANPSEIIDRAESASSSLDQSKLTVDIGCSTNNGDSFRDCSQEDGSSWAEGDIVKVTVSYVYDYITPLPGFIGLGSSVTVRASAEARFEGQ
jgi:Flp pilus assembly protein TadG